MENYFWFHLNSHILTFNDVFNNALNLVQVTDFSHLCTIAPIFSNDTVSTVIVEYCNINIESTVTQSRVTVKVVSVSSYSHCAAAQNSQNKN